MKLIAFVLLLAAPHLALAAEEIPALKTVFASKFLIGAAIEPAQLGSPTDAALLKKHFSSITAENVMKPHRLSPKPGEYHFGPADELVRFTQANGMRLRGHTLLWHRNAPEWFFAGDRSNQAAYRAEVRKRLERYITDVVAHFKGKVYAWDVVNEVASDDTGEVSLLFDTAGAAKAAFHAIVDPDFANP